MLAWLFANTIFNTLSLYLLSALVLVIAETVYFLFGFGSGLIAIGSLAHMIPDDLQSSVVLLLLVNLPLETITVFRRRKIISWQGVLQLCLGIAIGIPCGGYILQWGKPMIVLAILGGFLILVGIAFLLLPKGTAIKWPGWASTFMGSMSGLLAGLFGTGGPPLIIYYRLSGMKREAFRGNLLAVFFLVTMVRAPTYGLMGLITLKRFYSALAVFPAVVFGAVLGSSIHVQIKETTFQRLVSAALMGIGCMLLMRRIL